MTAVPVDVNAWHSSNTGVSGIMQDYPMRLDGPTTALVIERRRASSASEKEITLRRKLSRTSVKNDSNPQLVVDSNLLLNNPLPMLPSPSPSVPTVLTKKPSKSKPASLNIPSSSHSFLPPFLSIFSGKESPKDDEVEVNSSRFSRLRHKKSKVEVNTRPSSVEASFEPVPPMPVYPSTSTSDGVDFIMTRGRSQSIGKGIEESTSTAFRNLFPPLPTTPLSNSDSTSPASSLNPLSSRLLPPVTIQDKMEVDPIPSTSEIIPLPSRSRSRTRTNHSSPTTPRPRNQSYPEELKSTLTTAMLDSPIRVNPNSNTSVLRPRSKSVSNPSIRPKFIEDAFYSPDFSTYSPQPTLLPFPTADSSSSSSMSISILDANGRELSNTSSRDEGGVSIIVKSSARPDQFDIAWNCSVDNEGKTLWELQLKPKVVAPSLFATDYRVSSISSTIASSTSSHATFVTKVALPLVTPTDEFTSRASDFLNGPYSSPRRPSRGAMSTGSSISSEGSPLTPKRSRFPSSTRTFSASGVDLSSEEREVEIVGILPKSLGRSSSYSTDGIEVFQSRNLSIGSKPTFSSNPPLSPSLPKSPNQNRFGRYMPTNVLLRRDLSAGNSPSSDSSEFVPALSPSSTTFSKSTNLFTKDSSTISSSSSIDSLDFALTDGPTRREVNKGLRKMVRGRATSKWSDTENDDEEGLGMGKTSWS